MALTWRRKIEAVPAAISTLRRDLVEFARAAGTDRALCDDVALGVSEAANNVILHAYHGRPGTLLARASLDERDRLCVQIADRGEGFAARGRDRPGYGFGLMAKLCDQFCVEDGEDGVGTVVTMRFAIGDVRARRVATAARR